jgi:hypothetical protein
MALMAAHGEFDEMPDCAIFADTQAEPQGVYDHLKWLMSDNVLPFPVHIVTAGNLRDLVMEAKPRGNRKKIDIEIPAFLHRSCVPLDEVDLRTAEDKGQLNLWLNDCEGMCGV